MSEDNKFILFIAGIIVLWVAMAMGITFLFPGNGNVTQHIDGTIKPDVVEYRDNDLMLDEGYYYAVDSNTGVVYLVYRSQKATSAITVMLNPDGSPVTKSQLELP